MFRLRLPAALLPLSVAISVTLLVAMAARSPVHPVPPAPSPEDLQQSRSVIDEVDAQFADLWRGAGVTPAEPAEDLVVLRRLSLALHGTIPSLEEIRRFESDAEPLRLERWTRQMLEDRRFGDYFAARLARSFIGAEGGQFIVFRRDRFTNWLAEQLRKNAPFDETVRAMIAERGLWTGVPATNYITQAADDGQLDANKLAGRTVRAFLGQRIDCAQCHNHPFAPWKQQEFEGLAACFSQARITVAGIEDDASRSFEVQDRQTLQQRTVAAAVPFGEDWWPAEGTQRERLAAWITHPDNHRFERAIANRVWGLVVGRPWIHPVDDLPDPTDDTDSTTKLLDILGRDFREHHCDLKRLIVCIAGTRAFRAGSTHPAFESGERLDEVETLQAAFPLVRLRPEQMIGAMVQTSSVKTIDQNSHLLTRTIRFFREQDFVKEYGDLGERELEDHVGTIPQALLRMNGRFAAEISNATPASASGRISSMAPTDDACIETCFLTCLTRRPSEAEREFFRSTLQNKRGDERGSAVEDLYWSLINSPEFCWSH